MCILFADTTVAFIADVLYINALYRLQHKTVSDVCYVVPARNLAPVIH